MRRQFLNKIAALCTAICATAIVPQTNLRAEISASAQKLEGTWLATITRINPPPTVPPTFQSLHTYLPSGGAIETSNTGRTGRSVGIGEWVRTGDRQFTNTLYFFRFDPGEKFAGVSKLIRNIQLSEGLDTFRGVSVLEQYDLDGNLIVSLRSTEVGRRLSVGEIPDLP